MLVLMRRQGEEIWIGDNIKLAIVRVENGKVFVGVDAPADVAVHRREVAEAIERDGKREPKQEKRA